MKIKVNMLVRWFGWR